MEITTLEMQTKLLAYLNGNEITCQIELHII